jgi:hypothetical protein
MKSKRQPQRDKVLGELVAARGGWVSVLRPAAHSLQYQSRLQELRKMGFAISTARVEVVDGQHRTWYRLENLQPVSYNSRAPSNNAPTLFDLGQFEHHRDLG